ncbi:NAD(P)/FAD-dependent oxidoreductase [Streptomyces sp. WMMB 322]|uniref:NAD(P)/FAD-dependent oxidoreductase n=1 Tax=Streptomyces sp. WMMB 322 TaxID=1286821 RepID=UPI0006E2D34B|nr:FAD-dependent oxidoreductase [Streptomyces sp. WMMB 322]SCK57715.1 3-phenylpropionate/trans-cinnamate dioxygenase ferredoxin reductase subunit [Streptomyces sp. WMMB 322]
MAVNSPFVIVGAGLAGAKAAEALRERGFDGPLVLVGDEHERPYERPPLSKEYLQGASPREDVYVHSRDWYEDNGVELRLGVPVTSLDPGGHAVTLADGSSLPFAKLLLATGSSPRRLPVPGENLDGVHYLRRLADSDRLKETFRTASRIVVIGGGWIGLETTAAARSADVQVTLVEAAELPLLGVLGREAAEVFAGLHTEHGVDLRCGTHVTEITGEDGHVSGVRLRGGERIEADAVIVGVGITPDTGLAVQAGLDVEDGIRVDAALRSSHPDIWAAGDVACALHPLLGRHIRVEHWANALHQPATAARSMLGEDVSYGRLPYFFTDQYDLGMEYTGHTGPGGYDQVVFRGSTARREFIAFWLRERRVLAGMNVNVWEVTDPIRTLVTSGLPVEVAKLADVGVPLTEVFAEG